MSNFENLPEEEKKFILDEIHGHTMLSKEVIEEMLDMGYSYIKDGEGHKWSLNVLEPQTVAVPPETIAIPEILLPPSGIPINSNAVAQLYEEHKLAEGEAPTVEHIILMAILRAVHKGYQDREVAALAEANKVVEDSEKTNG